MKEIAITITGSQDKANHTLATLIARAIEPFANNVEIPVVAKPEYNSMVKSNVKIIINHKD